MEKLVVKGVAGCVKHMQGQMTLNMLEEELRVAATCKNAIMHTHTHIHTHNTLTHTLMHAHIQAHNFKKNR